MSNAMNRDTAIPLECSIICEASGIAVRAGSDDLVDAVMIEPNGSAPGRKKDCDTIADDQGLRMIDFKAATSMQFHSKAFFDSTIRKGSYLVPVGLKYWWPPCRGIVAPT